jgi:hypothetical protein
MVDLARAEWKEGGTYKSRTQHQILRRGNPPILRLHPPNPILSIKPRPDNDSFERTIALHPNDPINMVKVLAQLAVRWVIALPRPGTIHLGPAKLVLGDFGVDRCPRVAVPAPGAADVGACFENFGVEAQVAEGF